MGKINRRFNKKGREVKEVIIKKDEEQVPVEGFDVDGYDESNIFLMKSKKRPVQELRKKRPIKKPLSKKQRKRLEKILMRKGKKQDRKELYERLALHEIPQSELDTYTRVSKIGEFCRNLRKHKHSAANSTNVGGCISDAEVVVDERTASNLKENPNKEEKKVLSNESSRKRKRKRKKALMGHPPGAMGIFRLKTLRCENPNKNSSSGTDDSMISSDESATEQGTENALSSVNSVISANEISVNNEFSTDKGNDNCIESNHLDVSLCHCNDDCLPLNANCESVVRGTQKEVFRNETENKETADHVSVTETEMNGDLLNKDANPVNIECAVLNMNPDVSIAVSEILKDNCRPADDTELTGVCSEACDVCNESKIVYTQSGPFSVISLHEEDEIHLSPDEKIPTRESTSQSGEFIASFLEESDFPFAVTPDNSSRQITDITDSTHDNHKNVNSPFVHTDDGDTSCQCMNTEESLSQCITNKNMLVSLTETKGNENMRAKYVLVSRTEAVEKSRSRLPILNEEHTIMDCIDNNPIVIICGETGSGKTTQVPQFLYEYGYASNGKIIGITEPRRVAASRMSFRVAEELSLPKSKVSFQTRYEGNVTDETMIKFMTDGILFREIQEDLLLSKYSVVIIDEAHERSLFSDIIMGCLSRIVYSRMKHKRDPLKLVIMSATLQYENFTENNFLFHIPPPIISVDTRQYPVTIHHNAITPDHYMNEAFEKVCDIHSSEPDGGILVFVTGKQEAHTLCKRLNNTFPFRRKEMSTCSDEENPDEKMDKKMTKAERSYIEACSKAVKFPDKELDDYPILPQSDSSDEELEFDDGELELMDYLISSQEKKQLTKEPMQALPLYANLPLEKQRLVFRTKNRKGRICVVSTNVAETSLTLPGIKYVVDTGKVKVKQYNKLKGSTKFEIQWISKASAAQRAGRAGRTCNGVCYRLYSTAVFNDEFPEHPEPEIKRLPIEGLVLLMRNMGMKFDLMKFPFPTPPLAASIEIAESLLMKLGALKQKTVKKKIPNADERIEAIETEITPVGKILAAFPVNPRHAKIILASKYLSVLPYALYAVSCLAVHEYFLIAEATLCTLKEGTTEIESIQKVRCHEERKKWLGQGNRRLLGDIMTLLVSQCNFHIKTEPEKFCKIHGIRYQAAIEADKMRLQLEKISTRMFPEITPLFDGNPPYISDADAEKLRRAVLIGMADKIARKNPDTVLINGKPMKNSYQLLYVEQPAFIHFTSSLCDVLPEFVCYQELVESSRLFMQGVCAIEKEWLPIYFRKRCKYLEPEENPPPRYDPESGNVLCHVRCLFGPYKWELPAVEVPYPDHGTSEINHYRYFATFLLDGSVCPKLCIYKQYLLSPPNIMLKSWSRLQNRTIALLNTLYLSKVCSYEKLIEKWKTSPHYLLKEYLNFLPREQWMHVEENWPPL